MKASKVANLKTRDVREKSYGVYDLYSSRVVKIERDYIESRYRERGTRNVSCQCNIKRDLMCTCGKLAHLEPRYYSFPKQVYRYSDWRSFTDIGVGSVKALPRRRIRKIYLPETTDKAVGNVALSSYINQRTRRRWADSYYDNKRTSSKCVGGFLEDDKVLMVSKKLSPIIQKKSGVTSPKYGPWNEPCINTDSYNVHKNTTTIHTQVNDNDVIQKQRYNEQVTGSRTKTTETSHHTLQADVTITKDILPTIASDLKSGVVNNNTDTCKDFSSDSFVQHVHNLENPSDEKQSKMSVDPMENKLEREYRKMFTSKSKDRPSIENPIPNLKSASLLRRRFEALRRGLAKKESKKESLIINKPPSRVSLLSHKDVSIASDPPSLEGRSYSNTKIYSPLRSTDDYKDQPKVSHKKSPKVKKKQDNHQWSTDVIDSKYEGVQGMFKLWGKKFDLDEADKTSPTISNDVAKNQKQPLKSAYPLQEISKKKQGRKFFFFPKKNKEKENKAFKSKKGVTTGRCEVKDGLMIKVGGANDKPVKETVKIPENHVAEYEGLLRKAWLDKFITNAGDSKNSVHIRWNNKMYATSSSTLLELMDSVYKYTGIDFRSRSETTTGESSNYRSYTKQRVHFLQQDIEAWMIPKMIAHRQNQPIAKADNIGKCTKDVSKKISNHRWLVHDSKEFPGYIELLLHSKPDSKSSEYVIINIPKGYLSSSNEIRTQSSDEEIYKIVEYETPELKKGKVNRELTTEDTVKNNIKVAIGVQNDDKKEDTESKSSHIIVTKPLRYRDVAIQGSNVFFPKRCDVIGVGIITQREIRDGRKPIIKLEDELSDEESEKNITIQKKCELAESFLQDYCRNWMPSGIDLFPWHMSGSHLHSSGNNSIQSLSQGDCTKSCPNMYDDFQESTIVLSSCETSSCSHCIALEDEKKQDDSIKFKFLSKFKKKTSSESPQKSKKRQAPKDSLEVYKKRMFYASTKQKSKWKNADDSEHEISSNEYPKTTKPCWKMPEETRKKKVNQKHVSLPGCKEMGKLAARLSNRSVEGILSYKGSGCNQKGSQSPKHTEILPKPVCEIPQPACKESCMKEKKPACTKKNSPPCDDLFQNKSRETTPPCEKSIMKPPNTPPVRSKQKKIPCSSQCIDVSKIKQSCDKNFQLPNKPSQESGLSLKMNRSPKSSCESMRQKSKDCIPNCAHRKKLSRKLMEPPPPPPPTAYKMPLIPPTECPDNKQKVSGLYLKKLPSKKKTCSDDCFNWNSECPGVIRLNSTEKITIRMKKETPSTEEIREGLNIKVQDEDGQTLYERIDYKQSGDVNKRVLLKDMYKGHQIQRVSTPTIVQGAIEQNSETEVQENKSDASIDNLIEINFTLKLKQGHKGTKVDIKNGSDMEIKHNKVIQSTESKKDVYIVQDRADHALITDTKKDVNIKIIIKNYNTDLEKANIIETLDDNFTKRISEKFQTVSTGYSDVIDHNNFSVHRATVDLTTSTDPIFSKPCKCRSDQLIENGLQLSSKSVIERTGIEQTVNSMKYDDEEEHIIFSAKNSLKNDDENFTETDDLNDYKSEKHSMEKNELSDTFDEASNDSILYKKFKLRNKAEKKEMLRKLFKSSSLIKKPENKTKIKEIIRAILTSDSSLNEDIAVISNELAKELTYASLDPKCLRDTDSMNNYYKFDSLLSVYEENPLEKLYPTKTNSECSENESVVSGDSKLHGCMCSTFATKLNLTNNGASGGGCCCRKSIQKDVETVCDIKTDSYFLNLKSRIDTETQNSNFLLSKINSTNLRSKTQSFIITTASVTLEKNSNTDRANSKNASKYISKVLPDLNNLQSCEMKRLNRETILGLSDDEILVLNSNMVEESIRKSYKKKTDNKKAAVDFLQLNETKKAVLEIYAEKIVSNEGERIVAKLPKFDLETLNDINYEGVKSKKRISKRNIVMMSVKR